ASTELDSLEAKLFDVPPNLDRPLPYRYGEVTRGAGVAYGALPTPTEQHAAEPVLKRLKPAKPKQLGTGANDVPLDANGMAAGLPVLKKDAEGVGPDGYRFDQLYFEFGRNTTALPFGTNLSVAENRVLKDGSGVALIDSFKAGDRIFGLMPDGRFIPVDR